MSEEVYPLLVAGGPMIVETGEGVVEPLAGAAMLRVNGDLVKDGLENGFHGEIQYLGLLQSLVDKHEANPIPRDDRTGTGTYSVFGRQMRFDLSKGLPLLTTKKVFWRGVVEELLWMLSGSTSAKPLQDKNIHIWDEWCDEQCQLGPVYGKQWRAWDAGIVTGDEINEGYKATDGTELKQVAGNEYRVLIDQISTVIKNLQEKPHDRGHIVSAWNVADLSDMRLRPCHALFQFYVDDGKLSCQLYQRSADIFLGVPFNIASYALLTHIIAREVGLDVGEFIHTFGDLHLYSNHVDQAIEQLARDPRPFPTVEILGDKDIFDLTFEDFNLDGYDPHPAISAEVSV